MVQLVDQQFFSHEFVIEEVRSVEQMATAIREMHVRGAGLIGATQDTACIWRRPKLHGRDSFEEQMARTATQLTATRPTAVNISWAIGRQLQNIAARRKVRDEKIALALRTADSIADEDAEHCRMIGQHGLAAHQADRENESATRRSMCLLIATQVGWHLLITAPPLRRSTPRTTVVCHCMCG